MQTIGENLNTSQNLESMYNISSATDNMISDKRGSIAIATHRSSSSNISNNGKPAAN